MFSNADEVMKYIKDEDVKFVDVRFCDLPGVMQHFNVPAVSCDAEFFTNGQMFDGSSIRGPRRAARDALLGTPRQGSSPLRKSTGGP